MQNLIAALLLAIAAAYLLLKWMPAAAREKIRTTCALHFPSLAPLLTKAVEQTAGCGSGCSSCSSSTNDTCTNSSELKTVKLVRKLPN